MKQLHLFGIGSAIVDIQLLIEHHEFEALGLEKGTMNLVDADRQRELLERFAHLEPSWCSGGSAANTIIGFAQLGGKAGFGSILGNDRLGQFYANEFEELGIHLVANKIHGGATGTSVIVITPDSERTMNTSLAINSIYGREHLEEEAIRRSEWLYFEGYKFTEKTGAEAIEEAIHYAHKHDTKVAVSFSDTFVVNVFGDDLRRAVKKADLVFCNQSEAQAFAQTDNPDEAFRALHSEIPNVAMTLGEQGSHIAWNGNLYRVPAAEVTPIDTTGAGDMYAAGFLYAITHGYSPTRAGKLGAHAAAKVIAQLGARLAHEDIHHVRHHVLSAEHD